MVIIATLVGSCGPIFLKKASNQIKFSFSALKNKNLLAGVFAYAMGTILFIPALRAGELSVLYPLVGVTYIWVSILSIKFLGEKMNYKKWLGVFLIILGVALIGIGS